MFGNLFGSKKPGPAKKGSATPPKAKAPAAPKLRRVNLERRFTIIGETGQGSMSKVYRAVDNENGRTICLKVQDRTKTQAASARTVQVGRPPEGEIAVKIIHPHVVRTFEHGLSTKGDHYIVMEYVDGLSLIFVRQSRDLSLAAKIGLLIQAAEGLAAVHAAGFIHHDFGPKNLLVNRDDQVKLIDFGLAVPNTPAYRRPGNRTGTLHYMAPELIRREPTDERLDIFSFGATAFEFLSHTLPYDATDPMGMMRQRINSEPLKLERVAPHLPADLCAVVQKALTRRKEDRWPSMTQVADALRGLPAAAQ